MGEVRLIDANALRDLVSNMLALKEKYGINFDILSVIDNASTVDSRDKACEDCVYFDKSTTLEPCRHCTFAYKSCFREKAKEERSQGEWIKVVNKINECETETHWECSECHNPDYRLGEAEFCSFCGAKMLKGD